VLQFFKTATFDSPAQLQEVSSIPAGSYDVGELVKSLPIIAELRPASTPEAHERRCQAFAALALALGQKQLFAQALRALLYPDPILRKTLVAVLVRLNDPDAHGDLCALFASNDAGARTAAAEVALHVASRTVLAELTNKAKDPAWPGRVEAMAALVPRAGVGALPLLKNVLEAGRPNEKSLALAHLAQTERFAKDVPQAVAVAALALRDPDERIFGQAMRALSTLEPDGFWELCEPVATRRGPEARKVFLAIAAERPSPSVLAFFRQHLRSGEKAFQIMLLDALEVSPSEPLFPAIVDAVSSRDLAVRTRAMQVITNLAQQKRIDAARAIVWLLGSKDVNVRRAAGEIANQVGDADGSLSARLLKFLRDEDWWVRERVLDALIQMNGANLTKHIVAEYLSSPADTVRRFAVHALMRIGDARALGALVRTAQSDADWMVCEGAIDAMVKLNDQRAVPYLVELLGTRPALRLAAITALRKLHAKEALGSAAELLKDEDPDVRCAALEFLHELDDGTHLLYVSDCENDPSPAVREAAARVIRHYAVASSQNEESALSELKSLEPLLNHAVSLEVDDLILQAGRPPYAKRHGKMYPVGDEPMSGATIRELILPHVSYEQRVAIDEGRDVDFSYQLASSKRRFRVNVFGQLTGIGAVFRSVSDELRTLESLGLPAVLRTFANLHQGLVLVGGPAGAGKSTTLAAIVAAINENQTRHIVTIEDPIEVMHVRAKSLVNQREIGSHTSSFARALKSTLRQDPDVILIGELRDLETMAFAVTAAETGHLVLGTVHASSADGAIDRVINSFPAGQQGQIRSMLAESLRAVTTQYLLRNPKGGRVVASEVMISTDAIQSLIRKGKTFQIPSLIATSRDLGMQLMDGELIRLVKEGRAELEDAYAKCVDKRAFEAAFGLPTTTEPRGNPRDVPAAAPSRGDAIPAPRPSGALGPKVTRSPER
jgi:twitching motility protein PilT